MMLKVNFVFETCKVSWLKRSPLNSNEMRPSMRPYIPPLPPTRTWRSKYSMRSKPLHLFFTKMNIVNLQVPALHFWNWFKYLFYSINLWITRLLASVVNTECLPFRESSMYSGISSFNIHSEFVYSIIAMVDHPSFPMSNFKNRILWRSITAIINPISFT